MMKSTFTITAGGTYEHKVDTSSFNGGELNINLKDLLTSTLEDEYLVVATICDAAGVMALALIKDALDRIVPTAELVLYMAYTPYARQDRVCNKGEALGIKVFCNMINAMDFGMVVVLDPHSDVTGALLNNVLICPVTKVLEFEPTLSRQLDMGHVTLVAPDAGAAKKVADVAKHFGGLEVIQGMKHRDTATGALSGFGYSGDVKGKDLLIIDDICDGGGTFIGLAKELRKGGAKSLSLYVSHGIFSNGLYELGEYFDTIYTTDSFIRECYTGANLVIIKGV